MMGFWFIFMSIALVLLTAVWFTYLFCEHVIKAGSSFFHWVADSVFII